MTSAQAPGWQNPKILLMLFLVFLCGATAGMVLMATGAHHWMHTQTQPLSKEPSKDVFLQRLKADLNLSPAQSAQLETILDDFFTYYHTLQAQLDDVRASGRQRILRVLDDDQKKKFEHMVDEMQKKTLH